MQFTRQENQLLTYLARLSLDEVTTTQVRQLFEANLDWDYLRAQADRHNVLPLVHHHLSALSPGLPSGVIELIRSDVRRNAELSIFLTGELVKLMDLLQANNIAAVPFKGPTLALGAYGDIGLRQFADLDILIHEHDFQRVKKLLSESGYTPTPELTAAQESALRRFDCAYNFGDGKRLLIDVHWKFAAPYFSYQFALDRVWERLREVTISGRQIQVLAAEDLLLVLCLHGATHFWERLGWVADVAAVVSTERELNWRQVIANAAALGNTRVLLLGLSLAHELLGAQLPNEVLKQIEADAAIEKLTARAKERLFDETPRQLGLVEEFRIQLDLRENTRDKLSAGFRLAATPRGYDWMALPLPKSLGALHYLWRPLRLAVKYGAKLLNGSSVKQST